MQYATYLFDLDGTLYDRDRLVERLAKAQYREFQGSLAHIGEAQFTQQVIGLDAHGYFPKEQLYARLGKEWALSSGLQSQLLDHFWHNYNQHHSAPNDTLTTLNALKTAGKRIGIVTNGKTERQNKKIDALGLRRYTDTVVISEAEGIKKPHSEIFLRALQRLDSAPRDAVFIGDHPVADVQGALNAGLAAIWKRVPYWDIDSAGTPIIDNLSELLSL